MRNDLAVYISGHLAHARQRRHGARHAGADGVHLAPGRVTQLDVEGNVGAVHLQVAHFLRGAVILARVRVCNFRQCRFDVFYRDAHLNLRK
ncbi:hypothetical protein D3C86_1949350 [compost metagenome]